MWIGVFSVAGHLLFYFIWARWIPQPYENPWMRTAMALLALIYLLPSLRIDPGSAQSGRLFGLATWIQLPWFFTWMYWMNGGNPVWLASVAAMILIYFHATDWRLATMGLLSGSSLGWLTAVWFGADTSELAHPAASLVVVAFSLVMGLMLGMSSANLRRARLINTLSTMGVMAHELRWPR